MQKIYNKHVAFVLSLLMIATFIPTTSFASDTADTITYTVDAGDGVSFDEDDFNDACQDLNDTDLDYVTFELPSSSKGILYYDYDGDDETAIDEDEEYNYDDDESISDITFLADEDYSGTVSITYTGYDEEGDSYTGKVKITVSESDASGDIEYSVDAGDSVDFDEDDFNDYCNDENDVDLDYVTFELPSSSKGTIYYDYDGDDEEEIDDGDEFYYDDDASISDLSFVAEDDYTGEFEIDFTGYDVDGNSIEGTIAITVSGGDAGTADDIYASAYENTSVTLNATYFNDNCEELTGNTLDYVKFTLPSSSYGVLYYGYTSSDSYTSLVTASTKYYYESSPYITKVSFVPAEDYVGTVSLKYTGYDEEGTSFSGEVSISISENTTTATTSTPTTTAPLAAKATATPTSAKVVVNGKTISFDAYNIGGNNYFKLRDLAYAVNGSTKQFNVAFDPTSNVISLISDNAYTSVGGELAVGASSVKSATLTTSTLYKDSSPLSLGAYNINGNNYFKLRDIAQAFNIGVTWNATTNTVEINTAASYSN